MIQVAIAIQDRVSRTPVGVLQREYELIVGRPGTSGSSLMIGVRSQCLSYQVRNVMTTDIFLPQGAVMTSSHVTAALPTPVP
jgi:hypothetical protein